MKPIAKLLTAVVLGSLAFGAIAQDAATTPPSAKEALATAQKQAAKEHKSVFLLFHASWCIWCHRIDDMIADPKLSPIFTKNFVVLHIDGMEDPKDKGLENPGWNAMLTHYHGDNQGIPFWLFLSPKGKILATCQSPNDLQNGKPSNMGFPDKSQTKDEDFFIEDLVKAGAKLTSKDKAAIKSYLANLSY